MHNLIDEESRIVNYKLLTLISIVLFFFGLPKLINKIGKLDISDESPIRHGLHAIRSLEILDEEIFERLLGEKVGSADEAPDWKNITETINSLTKEIVVLKNDNGELFGKVRYLLEDSKRNSAKI